MSKRIKIRAKKPWIGYPGSTVQQNHGEEKTHGFFTWDVSSDNLDINFHELVNPCPYITIDWLGSVDDTLDVVRFPEKCRVRVRVQQHISHGDAQRLTSQLKTRHNVTEVVFKTDAISQRSATLQAGKVEIKRDELRSPDFLVKLLQDYHGDSATTFVSEEEWDAVHLLLKSYLNSAVTGDEALRNIKWTLKRTEFDNLFAYGPKNVIDWESLSGIVGIFGANRMGKSSIVGSLMYSLFNATDRGTMKNVHVINARYSDCASKTWLNVGGSDYRIERATIKNENKRGQINGVTALNVFHLRTDGTEEDLCGEQRTDTEKVVRRLIGNSDDFRMTSLSAQGEVNQFISHGSARRAQYLSRFLDLDVLARVHDLSNKDVNVLKSQLKMYTGLDESLVEQKRKELIDIDDMFVQVSTKIDEERDALALLQQEMALSSNTSLVTEAHVTAQERRTALIEGNIQASEKVVSEHGERVSKLTVKLSSIASLKQEYDIQELRKRLAALRSLESNITAVQHQRDKERTVKDQQSRSLKILDEVPCGDQFPSCKFIKDAHQNKNLIDAQQHVVETLDARLNEMQLSLVELKAENIASKITKIEQLNDKESELKDKVTQLNLDRVKAETSLDSLRADLVTNKRRLTELREALKNEENVDVLALRSRVAEKMSIIKIQEAEKIRLSTAKGRLALDIEKVEQEIAKRDQLSQRLKHHELISVALSKKGLPSMIANSQLPLINDEIAKILYGIVDFIVELEVDTETDSLEIYLNYGDSRRIIELGSGMEKLVASLAIRVALVNVSTLPKSDMFMIDEGFGACDEAGIEACNRLLISLKRYFRLIVLITHVDGVKCVADTTLEIMKRENDAMVVYERT